MFEVYPAAALKAWGLPKMGLALLLDSVRQRCPWLEIPAQHDVLLRTNKDAFDAMIASLVSRAAALGQTSRPRDDSETRRAKVEGWIAFPKEDSNISALLA